MHSIKYTLLGVDIRVYFSSWSFHTVNNYDSDTQLDIKELFQDIRGFKLSTCKLLAIVETTLIIL